MQESFHALLPLLRHVAPLNGENCRLTIPVVKGRGMRDVLPQTCKIQVFKCSESNFNTTKLVYNEFANSI